MSCFEAEWLTSAAAAVQAAAAAASATFDHRAALAEAARFACLVRAFAPDAAFGCFSSAASHARGGPATPSTVAVFCRISTGSTGAVASVVGTARAAACRDEQPRFERSFGARTRFATN
jgi:hypothetical protein